MTPPDGAAWIALARMALARMALARMAPPSGLAPRTPPVTASPQTAAL